MGTFSNYLDQQREKYKYRQRVKKVYAMTIYEELRKIINKNACWQEEGRKFELLWNLILSSDKRSFSEYFEEEHNIKLYDAMTFKEILTLCRDYNVGGRFK